MSGHQNAGRNYNVEIANKSCENVAKLQSQIETTIENQNYANKILIKIKFGKCFLPFSSEHCSSRLMPKSVKIKIYKTLI
jgi:hypothetical protein